METWKERRGKIIRIKRKQAGFKTQEALARELGCDPSRISRWETGDEFPDPSYRNRLHALIHTTDADFEEVPEIDVEPAILKAVERAAEKAFAKVAPRDLPAEKQELIDLIVRMNDADAARLLASLRGGRHKRNKTKNGTGTT